MQISIDVIASEAMSATTLREICDLCTEAYQEDFSAYLECLGSGVHVVGRLDGNVVSHAMWVTRVLETNRECPLRTAYIEAVATKPAPGESVMILRLPRTPADLDLSANLSAEWRPGELW